jgi:hypothetical protein
MKRNSAWQHLDSPEKSIAERERRSRKPDSKVCLFRRVAAASGRDADSPWVEARRHHDHHPGAGSPEVSFSCAMTAWIKTQMASGRRQGARRSPGSPIRTVMSCRSPSSGRAPADTYCAADGAVGAVARRGIRTVLRIDGGLRASRRPVTLCHRLSQPLAREYPPNLRGSVWLTVLALVTPDRDVLYA